jgi:hypothetical protein
MQHFRLLATVPLFTLTLLCGPGSAHATPIISSPTGLLAPTTSLTFDEVVLPIFASVTNQYQSFGVTFSPNLYYADQLNLPNVSGGQIGNFSCCVGPGIIVNPFSINFVGDVTASAFAMVTYPGISTFTALLAGIPIESFSVATTFTSSSDFYGFEGITFDQITVAISGQHLIMPCGSTTFKSIHRLYWNLQVSRFSPSVSQGWSATA